MIATETLDPRYDPDSLAQGHHTRSDLVWYGAALARLDRGIEGGPTAPRSLLGTLQSNESKIRTEGWLAPSAIKLAGDRDRAQAIERALARVLRQSTQWYRLLSEVWVRRGGQCGEKVDPLYLEVGLVCSTAEQRLLWTSRKGHVRLSVVVAWARRELPLASEFYDKTRDSDCGG